MGDLVLDAGFLARYLGVTEASHLGSSRHHGAWEIRDKGRSLVLKVFASDREIHFLREVAVLHHVRHPGLVNLDRCGRVDTPHGSVFWHTTDLVEGGDAGDAIHSRRWPDPEGLRGFVAATGSVLAELHAHGVIHRDVKPANIALRDGRWASPVLLDPGLVRFTGSDPPDQASVGTAPYMSPEQLRAESAMAPSDVFSLGVVLYRLLTEGRHPFAAAGEDMDFIEADRRIRAGPRRIVGGTVGALVHQMLEHDPTSRPAASELAAFGKR